MIWVLLAAVLFLALTLVTFYIGSAILAPLDDTVTSGAVHLSSSGQSVWNFFNNVGWKFWPFVILIGLIIWIFARAQKREPYEYYR